MTERMSDSYQPDLPNFLIAGVPKAGTSSLQHYLCGHPEIFMSKLKEPRFFDTAEFEKGVAYYARAHFSGARQWKVRGEATPSYFFHAESVIPRVREILGPDLKVIVVFRDPVARAWSHYLHARALCIEELDFATALMREQERTRAKPLHWVSYFSEGLYADRLEQWIAAFGRDSILTVLNEDLRDNRAETLRSVFTFLGVDSSAKLNLSAEQNASPTVRSARLMRWINRPSAFKAPFKAVVPETLRRRIVDRLVELNLSRIATKAAIPREIARDLRQRYMADICRLENLIGRDLSAWKTG